MCRPQKSAIWVKLSAVLSTSQAAVAWGMSGWTIFVSTNNKGRPFPERPSLEAI